MFAGECCATECGTGDGCESFNPRSAPWLNGCALFAFLLFTRPGIAAIRVIYMSWWHGSKRVDQAPSGVVTKHLDNCLP